MRTIKFRGKDRRTGKWFYGDLVHSADKKRTTILVNYKDSYDECEVDPETVGQFIGLYDKDGKEIYEGDILDFNGITVEVRFVRGVFALLVNGDLDEELCGDCRTDSFAKVIGNIHDNPELMKVNEKSKIRKHDTRRNP